MERKEEILKAASSVFQRYGLAKTTLEDIANRCGVKKTGLYYYFKNKEEILQMMFNTDLEIIKNNIKNAVEAKTTPQEKIRAYMLERLNSIKEQKKYFNMIQKDDLPLKHKQMAQELKKRFNNFEMELLTEIISDGVKSNIFNVNSIESLIYIITGTTIGLSYKLVINNQDFDITPKIDNIIEIILKGIEVKEEV